jgi:hypothetical protein
LKPKRDAKLPGDKLLLAGKSDRLNYILTNENIRLKGFGLSSKIFLKKN